MGAERKLEAEAGKRLIDMLSDELRTLVREAIREELGGRAPANDSEYLTARQVADLMQVDPKTVQQWSRRDGLPCVRLGRECRWRRSDLLQWLEARATRPGGHVSKALAKVHKLRG